jgi:hypothetical protein
LAWNWDAWLRISLSDMPIPPRGPARCERS